MRPSAWVRTAWRRRRGHAERAARRLRAARPRPTIVGELSPFSYEPQRPLPARRRASPRVLLALAGLALLAAAVPATAAASSARPASAPTVSGPQGTPALDAVVVAPLGATADADALQALLSAHGARGRLLYPPDVAVAHLSSAAATRLRAVGFAVLRAGASPPQGASRQLRRALRLIQALREQAQGPVGVLPAVDPAALGGGNDLKEPPPPSVVGGSAATPGATASPALLPGAAPLLGQLPSPTELAAYADGSVTVSVIFTQSTGVAGTEDWTADDPRNPGDRRTFLLGKIDLALAWWATYEWPTDPPLSSGLTFVIPPAGTLGAPQTVSVPSEPIAQSAANDDVWRRAVMTFLGFPGDSPPPETAYGDAVRRANATDWAFTVYVVDSLRDSNGEFTDGFFAYTYDLFGPYMVLTYDNDHYGPTYFDSVMAHEMGHVFGALDEYYMPPSSGYPSGSDLHSGYLWVRNANAENSFGRAPLPCIMRGGDVGIIAYLDRDVCPSTRGQVGWRDADQDGIPNVVDTLPSFTLPQPTVADDGTLSAAGTVRENPWPRGGKPPLQAFSHDISVYVPHDVLYRVDGGAWSPATATDADHAFDEPLEPFTLSAGPLANGHHLLELQATTGNAATLARDVWAGQTAVALRLSADRNVVKYGSSAALTVLSVATDLTGTFPVPLLPRISFARIGGTTSTLTTGAEGSVRKNVTPSHNRRYVATFAGAGQFAGPATSEEVTVAVRVAVTARRGVSPIRVGSAMRVWGVVRPAKPRALIALQESRDSGATWRTVSWRRIDASSRFSLVYRATHRGRILLRARYPGDASNLVGTAAVSRFTVS